MSSPRPRCRSSSPAGSSSSSLWTSTQTPSGTPEDRDKLLKDYSHGMKNKMQMLVNIIAQPNILLLDEPLTSLDVVVAEEMKNLLRSLKDGRITIFSTHILDLALDLCDEIVLLSHGELEVVEKSNLDDHAFKEKIIAALKEESYA